MQGRFSTRRRVLMGLSVLAFGTATALGLLLPLRAPAAQEAAPVSFSIFKGEEGGASNISLGSWGSGSASTVKQSVLIGDVAIKITTQGLYQGGRLEFKNPIDLTAALANPQTYMRFQLRFNTGATNNDPLNPELGNQVLAAPFERMRYVLTMADGTQYELVRPVVVPPSEDPDSYVPISFPISSILKKGNDTIPAPTGDGAKLKSIAIFGDKYQEFQIGEIGVITDDTDITVADLDDVIAYKNDELTFVGNAEGGASTLKYSWDFDASDGIQEDATGRIITHAYTWAGKFKVTLTVSDVDGLKKPVTTAIEFEVGE